MKGVEGEKGKEWETLVDCRQGQLYERMLGVKLPVEEEFYVRLWIYVLIDV